MLKINGFQHTQDVQRQSRMQNVFECTKVDKYLHIVIMINGRGAVAV
jgi:hypothetical protein